MEADVVQAAAAVVAVASVGVALVVIGRLRAGKADGAPATQSGEAKTLVRRRSSVSMSWEDLFDADDRAGEGERLKAVWAVLGFYAVAGAVTVAMAYMGAAWGYYIGLLAVGYATLIIGVNYVKARRRRAGRVG